jgi:hypothetical protein
VHLRREAGIAIERDRHLLEDCPEGPMPLDLELAHTDEKRALAACRKTRSVAVLGVLERGRRTPSGARAKKGQVAACAMKRGNPVVAPLFSG